MVVNECVWLWLPGCRGGRGAGAGIPIHQGGAEVSQRAQHPRNEGCRGWAGPEEQSKCHWAKLGPAVYPKKIILCLCDFYFSHLCLCNRRQNQKPALCQLCLNCAVPHVVTSDPGHDLPASVPKNFNSTAMMAFAEVKVEGRNLTL